MKMLKIKEVGDIFQILPRPDLSPWALTINQCFAIGADLESLQFWSVAPQLFDPQKSVHLREQSIYEFYEIRRY